MKKIYAATLLLCFLLTISKPVKADHLVGSDITYECTQTPGVFIVTLILYRDCGGIPICAKSCGNECSQTMSVKGADPSCPNTAFGSFNLSLVSVRDFDQKTNCPGTKSICDNMQCVIAGTYTPGIERYEFRGYVNIGSTSGIPTSCCNVRLTYEYCCRNSSIQTGSANQNFYVDAVVNRCLSVSPCNSSPKFTTEPYDIICAGEPFIYNNGTIEPDGDSLSFEFTPALQAFGSSITYDPPFAYNKPLLWTGSATAPFPEGIHCNPLSGDIMFTPPKSANQENFYGPVAILVKQWKTVNGVPTVIGTTRRDIQMLISQLCVPNTPPIITTFPPENAISELQPKLSWEVCEGSQLCFDVVSRDRDTNSTTLINDTTYLKWDKAIASLGATFTPNYVAGTRKTNGPREDSYKFCWTPAIGMASNIPYLMVVENNDSKCPIPGRSAQGFSIKVKKSVSLNYPITILKTDSGCGRKYLNTVDTNASNTYLKQWLISRNRSFNTDNTVIHKGTPNAFHIFNDTGLFYIQYKVVDTAAQSNLCFPTYTKLDSIRITTTYSLRDSVIINNTLCYNTNTGQLTLIGKNGVPPYTYGLNQLVFGTDSIFTALPSANYTAYIKDKGGCIRAHYNIKLNNPPRLISNGNISGNFSPYIDDTTTLSIPPIVNGLYTWSVQNGSILSGQGSSQIIVKWLGLGKQNVTLITSQNGCSDTVTKSTYIIGTGIPEKNNNYGVLMFPNPSTDMLNITLQKLPAEHSLKLYDMQGKLLIEQELKLSQQLNLESLPQGMYMLKIGEWRGQIIKK